MLRILLFLAGAAIITGCAVPRNENFSYDATDARKAFANTLKELKENPQAASERFDIAVLGQQIRKRRDDSTITDEQVETELVAVFESLEDSLPRFLPSGFIAVTYYAEFSDGSFEMKANIPLDSSKPEQFIATFYVHGDTARFTSMRLKDFSISALVSGRIKGSESAYDDIYADLDEF